MTVVTESATTIHHDGLITDALRRTFNYHDSYDLLTVPSLKDLLTNEDHVKVLANDVLTAVSLHHVEKLLIASMATGCAEQVRERIKKACPALAKMRIKTYTLERPRSLRLKKPLVITCMDYRLQGERGFARMMSDAFGLDEYGVVATAGAGKELGRISTRADMVLAQLANFVQKGLRRVIILSHTDCGKYGGDKAFADDHAQCASLTGDLTVAAAVLRNAFPNISVETGIIRCHGHEVTGIEPTSRHA